VLPTQRAASLVTNRHEAVHVLWPVAALAVFTLAAVLTMRPWLDPELVPGNDFLGFAAEVFFVLKGRWRFFWGRWGTAGEVVLQEGDIINIPTGIFRGFENIGTDYGILNIGGQLAVFMALAGLGEWLLVGSVIGLVYKRPGV